MCRLLCHRPFSNVCYTHRHWIYFQDHIEKTLFSIPATLRQWVHDQKFTHNHGSASSWSPTGTLNLLANLLETLVQLGIDIKAFLIVSFENRVIMHEWSLQIAFCIYFSGIRFNLKYDTWGAHKDYSFACFLCNTPIRWRNIGLLRRIRKMAFNSERDGREKWSSTHDTIVAEATSIPSGLLRVSSSFRDFFLRPGKENDVLVCLL